MPAFTSYDPGTPSWVDIATTDMAQTTGFYGALLGWTFEDKGEEAGSYHVAYIDGKQVAGLGPQMMDGQPCAWTTYVSVEDADKSAEVAAGAGATVLVPPMDVMTLGRMAVFMDPTGAAISVWQPKDMAGAELANEPGALAWNELNTRDIGGSKAFYGTLFGWTCQGGAQGPMEYYEYKVGEKTVAGMMPMPEAVPAQVPNHWLVYFAVADCDASAAKVKELGGQVIFDPMDIPAGRFTVCTGLLGEPFGIIKL